MISAGRQSGITLIEILVYIVVISVGIAGLLSAYDVSIKSSADPMVRKQLVAAAESMMDEILAQPVAGNGLRPAGGATQANRAAGLFDEIDDYHGFATTGIYAIDGTLPVSGLSTYSVAVSVSSTATLTGVPASALRLITVVMSGNGESFSLAGYKSSYAE